MTDEDRCWCAAQWASGVTLREIGTQFPRPSGTGWRGLTSATIHTQIYGFLADYVGDKVWREGLCGASKKRVVPAAIAAFLRKRAA